MDMLLPRALDKALCLTLALSFLIGAVALARKNLTPVVRSWLWAACVPALFLPFEQSILFVMQKLGVTHLFNNTQITVHISLMSALAYLWLIGVVFCLAKTALQNRKTLKLIKACRLGFCAAYFYRFRSRIYLPPDFKSAYTQDEQDMLLAHEKQHVAQHDPLLFWALRLLQCVFWFCPPVHIAVRLIRHDRELLCDERVTRNFSKREYGSLLLREAGKAIPGSFVTAGIASEATGLYERVKACAIPFSVNRKAVIATLCAVALLLAANAMGAANQPASLASDSIRVVLDGDDLPPAELLPHIEGAERFVSRTAEGLDMDEKGLYGFLTARGYQPEQRLYVFLNTSYNAFFGRSYTLVSGGRFLVEELETREISYPYIGSEMPGLWKLIYFCLSFV
jgi:hypothetical protein